MQPVLIIKNNSYMNPFYINRGSSVACTFSDVVQNYPFFERTQPVRKGRQIGSRRSR